MFELVFLGTSASAPSAERGLSSAILMHRDKRFMIDCGEGTQRQLLISGLGFRRLHTILLTHGHLDHILGLGGLLSTMGRWEMIDHVRIYGAAWPLQRVQGLLDVVFGPGQYPLKVELEAIEPGVLMQDEYLTVSVFPVVHRGAGCLGYLFEEPPRRPFLPEKAEALGVPPGPERRRLVQGETITLPSGQVVTPDDVLGEPKPGVRVAFVGDAAETESLMPYCQGVDALVIEATYLDQDAELAHAFGHLTAGEAARFARAAGVKHLILTHISRRYTGEQVEAEAKAIFPHTFVANDFDLFEIRRDAIVRRNLVG
ncbi:MAG: ribonuclease Z [Chloroflexi bacterium]|nr:ribonuclease Z [Chloroflexota bacterium]